MKFYSHADAMRDYCIFYFILFLIVWAFSETDADRRRNEKSQQTFVVRYKNGDQTIPVTVVLDDKKQTEYVINMSPRTPEKSVTLYDFKQRTIAYKDLTNRECFLGRLTDETLTHEFDALNEVQNPIESNPKVLSLVPYKSALTPTEIRNIAGQKTAVFCRKMNTWLIMPQGNHNILKREVEEIEERSYSRHGFHTVKYSHHGRETRRRYRKPSATSILSTHEKERTSEHHGVETWNSTSNNTSSDHTDFENSFENHGGNDRPNSLFSPETSLKQGEHLKTNNEGLNFDYFHNGKTPLETDFNSPHQRLVTHQNLRGLHLDSHNYGNEELFTKYKDEVNNLNRDEVVVDGNGKKYIQSSKWDPLFHPSNFHNPKLAIGNRHANDGTLNVHENRSSNIESEGDSLHETKDIPEGGNFLSPNIPGEPTENPEVSINVLEIPKISKKFENLDHVQDLHETFVQPNEDVHSIFEGFHKLNESLAPSGLDNSYNPIPFDVTHQKTENVPSLKTFETEKSPVQKWFDSYGERQTMTPIPVTKENYIFTTSPLGFNDLNLSKVSNRGYVNGNINHHGHRNKILAKNHLLSNNLPINKELINTDDNHFRISLEKNGNSSRHMRFDNHNSLNNFSFGKYNNETQHNVPTFVVNQPPFPPNQLHLRDILRSYKPDEIVIDIEKIPTEKPLESTSSFRGRNTSFTRNYDHRHTLNRTNLFPLHNKNSNNLTSSSAPFNDSQKPFPHRVHLPRRKNFSSHTSDGFPASNNFLQMNLPPKHMSPPFLDQLPSLGALPPGVSLHPRHPQAPYADMVRTNMLHTLPQRNINRPIKPHRQRHHRRKDHSSGTCCKSNSGLSACCSWHLRRGIQINSSCCASSKHRESLEQRRLNPTVHARRIQHRPTELPTKDALPAQVLRRANNFFPSVQRKLHEDKRDRCQKEKMCRTLYESTRQVMVCRNINVEGC